MVKSAINMLLIPRSVSPALLVTIQRWTVMPSGSNSRLNLGKGECLETAFVTEVKPKLFKVHKSWLNCPIVRQPCYLMENRRKQLTREVRNNHTWCLCLTCKPQIAKCLIKGNVLLTEGENEAQPKWSSFLQNRNSPSLLRSNPVPTYRMTLMKFVKIPLWL